MLCFRPRGRSFGRSIVKSMTIGNPALRLPETRATLVGENYWRPSVGCM
jgi:hypothetical protein